MSLVGKEGNLSAVDGRPLTSHCPVMYEEEVQLEAVTDLVATSKKCIPCSDS